MRNEIACGASLVDATNFIAVRTGAPKLASSFENEIVVGKAANFSGGRERGKRIGPGGCELGMRRSAMSGGAFLRAGSVDRYEGTCSTTGKETDFISTGRTVLDASAGSSASSQRKMVRPSSEPDVIKLTRAGGGSKESAGG